MSQRFRLNVWKVEQRPEGKGPADYVPAGDELLVPRAMAVEFQASIHQPASPEREEISIGKIDGIAAIENGVASIYEIKVDSIVRSPDPDEPDPEPLRISDEFLKRLSMADLGLAIVARCSLTRWQEAHYALEPIPTGALEAFVAEISWLSRQIQAMGDDAPIPVRTPPKPVFTDAEGVPWYRVQVVENVRRHLPWRRNARITPDFLSALWTVYRAAREAGEPTTEAVREWADLRTGRIPSNPTIFRWIKQARELYGEEAHDA